MGIKLKDLAGIEVIVQLRMVSSGYYASVLEDGVVSGGSSTSGILGRGATINEAIADLLKGRERIRTR